jgi:molybdopterin synthase catalytic subunit
MARWSLLGCTLIHRHGTLAVGDRIVLVGTASRHRAAALEACAFLIDWAKTKAPLWKQELFADGSARWVEARAEDDVAAAEWDASAEHGKP